MSQSAQKEPNHSAGVCSSPRGVGMHGVRFRGEDCVNNYEVLMVLHVRAQRTHDRMPIRSCCDALSDQRASPRGVRLLRNCRTWVWARMTCCCMSVLAHTRLRLPTSYMANNTYPKPWRSNSRANFTWRGVCSILSLQPKHSWIACTCLQMAMSLAAIVIHKPRILPKGGNCNSRCAKHRIIPEQFLTSNNYGPAFVFLRNRCLRPLCFVASDTA